MVLARRSAGEPSRLTHGAGLQAIVELDLDELAAVELPQDYGRN